MATTIENHFNCAGQEEEIQLLRDHFKDNIRILSSIGQFSHILKIRADQYDVSITLQLDESYPMKPPEIIITAPRLIPDQILLVQKLLQSHSEKLLNQPMVLPIYLRLIRWLDENNIQTLTVNTNNNTSIPRSPSNGKSLSPLIANNNHSKTSQNDEHSCDEIKRCFTKTVDDVITRIEWDNRLDKRYIRVGYIDHFHGLQEKPYNDLNFKNDSSTISDQQTNTLTVSRHRVQYFKYANKIIWDKKSRIDLMFGSTANQQTIYDVIKQYENHNETKTSQEDTVDIDYSLSTNRYLTLTDGLYKPNYFLSIPIHDTSILSNYTAYREHLLSSCPSIFSSTPSHCAFNDPQNLHLTLLTLRLETSLQIEQCIAALKRIQEEIHYHCSYPERICLEFRGIDTFHNRILFIKCEKNNRLENLRTLIIERLYEQQEKDKTNDICFAGNYQDFIPHITICKTKRKLSSIYPQEPHDIYFGKQLIHALQLCSIKANENEQQYHCIFKLDLS